MNERTVIKRIIDESGITKAGVARAMKIKPQSVNSMLNAASVSTMRTDNVVKMLRILGYELVAVPLGKAARIDGAYVIDDSNDGDQE